MPPRARCAHLYSFLCGRRQWLADPFICCPTIRSRPASFASVPTRACDLRRCGGWRAPPRRERLALAARRTPTIRRPYGHEVSCRDRTLAPDSGRAARAASLACSHASEPGRAARAARPVFDSHARRALLGQSTRTELARRTPGILAAPRALFGQYRLAHRNQGLTRMGRARTGTSCPTAYVYWHGCCTLTCVEPAAESARVRARVVYLACRGTISLCDLDRCGSST